MTYCLGIVTKHGLIMGSDSRTNAGSDQVATVKKMHTLVHPGERVFVLLCSGSLSCSQSILTLLKRDFDSGHGLALAPTMYDAARVVGQQVRKISALDREYLERDEYKFNVNFILGGQIRGEAPKLFLVYPQGNPLEATDDAPFLQIGEIKYGRPILDRGVRYDRTTLEEGCKYALLSMDSTMKSNASVGPPIDLLVYANDEFDINRYRRFEPDDPDLQKIRTRWEQALRQAIMRFPELRFKHVDGGAQQEETIELFDRTSSGSEPQQELQSQTAQQAQSRKQPG